MAHDGKVVALGNGPEAHAAAAISGKGDLRPLNPFQVHDTQGWVGYFVYLALVVVIFPIKFTVFFLTQCLQAFFMWLTVLGADTSKPLSSWRMFFQNIIAKISARIMCAVFGIYWINVEGKRAKSKESKLFVGAPHSTLMDGFVFVAKLGSIAAVAKAELSTFPGKYTIKANQTILVDRTDPDSRQKTLTAIKERIDLDGPWKRQLGVFPEGTCTNRTSLIDFKKGAFQPGQPVQPVCVDWGDASSFDPAWTSGAPSRMRIAFRCATRLWQPVTLRFLPVYVPSEEEKADPMLFKDNVRAVMAEALGVPTTAHSYADMFIAKKTAKLGLKPACVMPFTFASLVEDTADLGVKDDLQDLTKKLLGVFAKAPRMKDTARMNERQFGKVATRAARVVELDAPLAWEQSLAQQVDSDGKISFRTFLLTHLRAKYANV